MKTIPKAVLKATSKAVQFQFGDVPADDLVGRGLRTVSIMINKNKYPVMSIKRWANLKNQRHELLY